MKENKNGIIPLNRHFKKQIASLTNEDFFEILKPYETILIKKNWISIKKISKCLFSRRNGKMGIRLFGYSICLRLFGKNIL